MGWLAAPQPFGEGQAYELDYLLSSMMTALESFSLPPFLEKVSLRVPDSCVIQCLAISWREISEGQVYLDREQMFHCRRSKKKKKTGK